MYFLLDASITKRRLKLQLQLRLFSSGCRVDKSINRSSSMTIKGNAELGAGTASASATWTMPMSLKDKLNSEQQTSTSMSAGVRVQVWVVTTHTDMTHTHRLAVLVSSRSYALIVPSWAASASGVGSATKLPSYDTPCVCVCVCVSVCCAGWNALWHLMLMLMMCHSFNAIELSFMMW